MTKIKTNAIPHRQRCIDKEHPYVSGARDIYDDEKEKSQEQINKDVDDTLGNHQEQLDNKYNKSEVYKKDETYSKTQLNNLITTPEVNYVNVDATDQTTAVTDVLPATGAANTIYKVGKWDGTQYNTGKYTEYAWDGTSYIPLATRDHGVDNKPSNGSENFVKSGGVDNADVSIIKQLSTEITSYTSANYAIQGNGNFGTGDVYKHGVIAVNEGDTYIIENYDESADTVRYAFVTTDAVTAGGAVPVVSGTGIYIVKHGTSALVTIPAGCSHLIWNAPTRFNSKIYTPYDYIKLSDFPELLDSHPVKGNGIIQTIWNYVNENIGKRIEALSKVGFILESGVNSQNGKGFVFSVSEGDTVVLSPSSNYSYYAFLTSCIFKYSLVSGTSRIEVTADTTFTIPAGCSYLWVAESYQSYNYKPTKLLINGEDVLTNKIDNIPVIYGNQFIISTDAVNLSDVLSAVPLNFRKPLSVLLWRDSQQKLQINVFNSQQPQNASTWGNENNWVNLITDKNIEQYLYTYPLQFNNDVGNHIVLRVKEYITLSNDGDSFEADVTVGNKELTTGGYGFSSSLESHDVGIGLSYQKTCVRADDGTWLLSTSQYAPFKARYTFKIEYTNGNILFYVDNVLIHTYTGQKTLTLIGFGNGATHSYGYWNGIIHSIKVNGQRYAIEKSPRTKFDLLPKEDFSNLYIEKTADTFTIYKQLSDNLYVAYPLIHAVKAFTENEYPSFYNNWGLREPKMYYFNGTSMTQLLTLFRDGEAETAVEATSGLSSDKVYVSGSTHGFELIKESVINETTVRHIAMIVDNMTIGETDVISLRPANYVEIKQYSQLYQAYTNTNPFADVVKNWIFGDKVNIKTKVSFTRDIAVNKLMQGMFCVYRRVGGSTNNPYLTNKAFKDNTPYIVYNVVDGWEDNPVNEPLHTNDPECSKISEYGELGLGFALAISDDNRNSHGGMFVSTNNGYYNKIYFASHRGSETITAGTEYHATQEWTIFI